MRELSSLRLRMPGSFVIVTDDPGSCCLTDDLGVVR